MYSPYDQYLDQLQKETQINANWSSKENYFMPGRIATGMMLAGGIATGGLAVGAGIRMTHNRAMKNSSGYAKTVNKLQSSKFYKTATNPIRGYAAMSGIGFREMGQMDDIGYAFKRKMTKSGVQWRNKAPGFSIPKSMSGMFTPKQNMARYGMRVPMLLPAMFLMGATSAFAENNHPSALAEGLGRTALSFAGMGVGNLLGAGIGTAIMPGIGTIAGALIGSVAGSIGGDSIIGAVKWMKHKGREWTHPDLGGGFKDSKGSQTMRQRSLLAINTSQFNVRSGFGQEAIRLAIGSDF